ncbi:MAG: NTP transferase domain-containing protein [Ignavibacteriaceae bacterium]|nr:NTP transferase domain-containing protein [Ignavibacteriaceae bacterium]
MSIYAVVMAGGIGSRFWPKSNKKTPKQLMKIFGEKTLIQETVERLTGFIDDDKIYIVTNRKQRPLVVNQLPQLPPANIIAEPFGRETAPCIGLASIIIQKRDPDALIINLPADHLIRRIADFHLALKNAIDYASKTNGLVTIGILPSRPEIGYGYIQIDEQSIDDNIHKVYSFAEKPNYATAVRFIESGDFLWNSGIFIWKASSILNEIQIHLPDLFEGLEEIKAVIDTPEFEKKLDIVYGQLRKISIDYGVMEKSKKVFLTKGDFIWSDVGSWEEVYQLSEKDDSGNCIRGKVYTDMTVDSFIFSPEKFTAVIGAENLIVVHNDDALLVCRRDQAQSVKKIVDYLKMNKLNAIKPVNEIGN